MSKTSILKEERAARKEARIAERAAKVKALEKALESAKVGLKVPSDIGLWCATKTACWVRLHEKLTHQTKLVRKKTERIDDLNSLILGLPKYSPDQANKVLLSLARTAKA